MNNIEEIIGRLKTRVALAELIGPDEMIVSASDLSALIAQLEAAQKERDEFRNRLKLERSILEDTDKQLAELKALEPVAWQSVSTSSCNRMVTLHKEMAKDWERKGFAVTPLFTAAKPNALPRHIYSMLVNELRDVPAIGCKRELIVSVLNRHGVIAELVGG